MACCLIVPNYYLNQCCLTVNKILLDSSQGNIYDINPQVLNEIYILKSLRYSPGANGLRAFVLCIITGLVKCVDVPLVVVLQLDDFVAITKLSVLCYDNFNPFWPSDAIWLTYIWVNIDSGNGLLPDGTKPLPEPMLTIHQ